MDLATSFDPLIAEAKRRTLRRRFVFAAAIVGVVATGLTLGLRPSGSSSVHRATGAGDSSKALAGLTVPFDSTERHWRAIVRSMAGSPAPSSQIAAIRRRVLSVAKATGATPVRVRIWRTTSPPAVEVVLATNVDPAVYLRHRAVKIVNLLATPTPDYVKVVDGHGSLIWEWGGAANEGFVGRPPALRGCGPVFDWGDTPPPCPVK